MKYNLGSDDPRSDRLRSEDIDPWFIAAVIEGMDRYRDELSKAVAPVVASLIDTVRSLQPVIDSFNKSMAALGDALLFVHERVPQNWPPPPNGKDLEEFYSVLDDGIPLAFIPRRETVAALLAAPDYPSRVAILVDRTADVIDECRAALDEYPLHVAVVGLRPLVDEALTALAEGYRASAQALAVCVSDTLLHTRLETRKYSKIVEKIESTDFDEAFYRGTFRSALALRPCVSFVTSWDSLSGDLRPDRLSRHATVHGASPEQFSESNAIIAVMLATSLLLGISERNRVSDRIQRAS